MFFRSQMLSKFRIFTVAAFLPVTALLAACDEAPKSMVMPPTAVQLVAVGSEPFKEKSDYLGTMRSRKSVTLSPNVDGHITEIFVTAGQFVKAGEQIMQIDSRMQFAQTSALEAAAASVQSDLETAKATLASLQSTLSSREANVEYTKAQHARYHALRTDGAVAQSELDSWKNNSIAAQAERDAILQQIEAQKMTIQKYRRNHEQSLANLKAQNEHLKYYHITAPFSGIIGDIPVKVGDHVTSSTALTALTENHPLEAYISVPAEKASAIRPGTKVSLAAADGDQYGEGQVTFIAPTVDPSSQTVLIKALYPNIEGRLRADQTVRAQIVWQVKKGISVPTKAVTQTAGKYFVFVAQDAAEGKMVAKQAEIQVYGIEGTSYQVKNGLKSGDRVVTTGIQRLADGAPIMPKSEISENGNATAKSQQQVH